MVDIPDRLCVADEGGDEAGEHTEVLNVHEIPGVAAEECVLPIEVGAGHQGHSGGAHQNCGGCHERGGHDGVSQSLHRHDALLVILLQQI